METSPDHWRSRFLHAPLSIGLATGLALVVLARWVEHGAPSVRVVAGGVVAVVIPAWVAATFQARERPVAAAAVLLACTPTVLIATADGRWQGAVALLMVALVVWSRRPPIAALTGLVALGAFVAWWRAGFDRGNAPGPSWRDVVAESGETVRRALTSVGVDEALIPLSAALLLALGIGVLVGAVVLTGRPSRAAALPAGIAVLVGGIWMIRLWRGSVDPLGGAWLFSTAVALLAVEADPPSTAGRRIGTTIAAIGSIVLLVGTVADLGGGARPSTVLTAVGVGVVAVSLVVLATAPPGLLGGVR